MPCGRASSNEAEYLALISALQLSTSRGLLELEIFSDSALVVNQIGGSWRVKNGRMKSLHAVATTHLKKFTKVTLQHVPREFNKKADALSKATVKK